MNPLVKQMLNVTVSNDVETRLLEDLFEQNVECESPHTATVCSIEVTHRYSSCAGEWNTCWNSAKPKIEELHGPFRCTRCKQDVLECWTIRPI